ncbi:hypothetical protein PROFUN_05069 [Planoprotostelium fungivorum]|uniref:Uncharacterized protein n=1 Tax=Planoprotostelium fungivorum TaxID=1890364 RepID=A0A2P6NSA2_9EUKA|nr:hypothetical protein PROFUN_05069 [Planoprotostelium fungivorum]
MSQHQLRTKNSKGTVNKKVGVRKGQTVEIVSGLASQRELGSARLHEMRSHKTESVLSLRSQK